MAEWTILHNNRCRKSREGLAFLEEQGVEHSVREYLKEPLSAEEVKALIEQLGIDPLQDGLIRKGEADFKEHFKGKTLSPEEWAQAIAEYPKLLERPILVGDKGAAIGRPLENFAKLLKS